MADTASLIVRVKAEGAEQAADQLDDLSAASAMAEGQAAAYARAQAKAAAEAKKSVPAIKGLSDITEQLGNKIAILDESQTKGARSAAILAAQLKAGANASSEEITRIGELTGKLYDMTTATKSAASSQDFFTKSATRTRTQFQQVGYQVQDLTVQLQGGTSAFVAIGQQGSQLAGAFGPGGAVLGAVIALASAVGGALYKSFGEATIGAEDLQKATKNLQSVLKEGSTGALEFTDDLLKLAEQSNAAALAKLASSIADANTQIKAAGQTAADTAQQFDSLISGSVGGAAVAFDRMTKAGMSTTDILKNISSFSDAAGSSAIALRGVVDGLSNSMGITKEQALGLVSQLDAVQKSKSPETVQALANSTANLQAQYGTTNPKLNEFNNIMQESVVQMMNGKNAAQALQGAYNNLSATIDKLKAKQAAAGEAFVAAIEIQSKRGKELINAQNKQLVESINQREGLTEDQRKRALAAANKAAEQDLRDFDAREQKKADTQNKRESNRVAAQAKRDANAAAAQKKAAETFLATIDRQSGDEIARINTTEKQKLDKLAEFQQQGAISAQQFEDTKTQIQLDAETARQEELTKRKEEQAKKEGKHDQFIADMEAINATELELIDVQQKAKEDKAKEFRDRGIINEEEYQASLAAIAKGADDKRVKSYSNMLGQTTDDLKTALGEGNAMYKAFAIANAIMQTYVAANAAYQSAAAIPIVGWIAGPIAAAAAVAAGLANVGKIRSAREQGGNLSAGQASTIAERKAEVIVPASASRVRTAQQMRQIMGENSSSSSTNNGVVIVNNTTGRVDSAMTELDDEGRLRVIIDEHVSSAIQDSNSNISKSRRATRGLPGF